MVRAGLTTERLTRAGAELADEVGFDQVTVSALARRFDVKVASLYSHLKSSQDLRTRIALFALEELADRVAAALAGRAGRDALAAFADAYRDYAREHPGRYAAARLPLDPRTAAASAGVRHAQMTRAILRGYDLAEPDQTHAVRMLGSVFHGYVSLELSGGFSHTAVEPQESWNWIVDSLDVLLRTGPRPERPAPAPPAPEPPAPGSAAHRRT
ncbi:TetR/AcrR family transcriptional regulator [Kitasatospora sp. NBC_00315]|uniref:TetR/AcrR family transcriptional regulator n=1 Tax=Kitasatospora sp. NBC_00315 TaxID=2975963 RepID=UPI003256899A